MFLKDAYKDHQDVINKAIVELIEINGALEHRYRDAIVSSYEGPYEKTSFGAYVLFPWFDEDMYSEHHFYKSIDEVNIGGLPLLPNATSLVERVVDRLIDKSPQEIHEEGILPRGTIEEWKSKVDEKIIVGLG